MGKLSDKINYRKISEANTEFRRSDYWLITITPPKGLYFPGNELLQIRTNTFSTGITDDPTVLNKKIRTFTINQGAKPEATNGVMELELSDRIDQSIAYWIDQWKLALGERDQLSGLAKELYISPSIRAAYFDINEVKVRELLFVDCMIESAKLPEDGTDAPELEGNISVSIAYQHFYRTFNNANIK